MGEQADEAGDELLMELEARAKQVQLQERANVLAFGTKCLGFVVPRPKVTRALTSAALTFCFFDANLGQEEAEEVLEERAREIIGNLLRAAPENREYVVDTVKTILGELLDSMDRFQSAIAAEVALNLSVALGFSGSTASGALYDLCGHVARDILSAHREQLEAIGEADPAIANELMWRNLVSPCEFINRFGVEALFKTIPLRAFKAVAVSPAEGIVGRAFGDWPVDGVGAEQFQDGLAELGPLLTRSEPPWVAHEGREDLATYWFLVDHGDSKDVSIEEMSADCKFAGLLLVAVAIESSGSPTADRLTDRLRQSEHPAFRMFRHVLTARLERTDESLAQRELDASGFDAGQQAFAWSWARGDVNLVATPTQESP